MNDTVAKHQVRLAPPFFKRLDNLSRAEQEKIELEYHQMDPVEFDDLMSQAKTCATASVRLPGELVELLKVVAKLGGIHPRWLPPTEVEKKGPVNNTSLPVGESHTSEHVTPGLQRRNTDAQCSWCLLRFILPRRVGVTC